MSRRAGAAVDHRRRQHVDGASAGLVHPPRELKSEVAIICGIAKATLLNDGIDWSALKSTLI
jgi:hypothetical protein